MVQLKNSVKKETVRAVVPPKELSIGELKASIPAHCFKRSALYSTLYLILDMFLVGGMLYLVHNVWNPSMLPAPLSWIGWAIFALVQGTFMTGMWVVAHEAGHQAYSESNLLNDTVGYFVHSALMVPYFSWKISHAKHHMRTGNMDEDEVFVPAELSASSDNVLLHSAPLRLLQIFVMLVFGWPAYLLYNASSHKTPDFVSHYWPYCSLFSKKEHFLVVLSDVGVLVTAVLAYKFAMATSFAWMMSVYGFPLLVTNAWLVTITALHHTNKAIPHYRGSEWNWVRGALATVDRDYGFVLNFLLHHIADTHVAHHLFAQMPHYHAVEATECLKKKLGNIYNFDGSSILSALWVNTVECFAVDDNNSKNIFWWAPPGAQKVHSK